MRERLKVTVCDGKYTVIQTDDGLRALRYGQEWRDLTGDGLVLALAQEVDELRDVLLYAQCYIQYVKEHDPHLHQEADGTPGFEQAVKKALMDMARRAA